MKPKVINFCCNQRCSGTALPASTLYIYFMEVILNAENNLITPTKFCFRGRDTMLMTQFFSLGVEMLSAAATLCYECDCKANKVFFFVSIIGHCRGYENLNSNNFELFNYLEIVSEKIRPVICNC